MANLLPLDADPQKLLQMQALGGAPGAYAAPVGQTPEGPQVLPYTSTTITQPSGGSSRMPETAQVKAAEASQEETRQMAEEAQRAKITAKIQEETFKAEQAERENTILKRQMEETARVRQDEDAKVSQSLTDLRARQKEAADFKPTTYVEDMGTLARVLSAIGVGLGEYGSKITGGPNTAYQIYESRSRAHQEKQRAIIEQKARAIEDATGNLAMAQDFRNKSIASVNEKYLLENKYLQKLIEGKIAKIPTAAAEGQAALASLRKDYDKTEMETAQRLAGTVTREGAKVSQTTVQGEKPGGGGARGVTESEATRAMYGARMKFGIKEITANPELTSKEFGMLQRNVIAMRAQTENATKGLFGPAKVEAMKALNLSPESLTSGIPDSKKPSALGWLVASNLVIRDESGAAINLEENISNAQKLIPQADDGPAAKKAKFRTLENNAELMMRAAGPAARARMEPTPAQPQAPQAQPRAAAPAQPRARNFAQERRALADPKMRALPARDRAWAVKAMSMDANDPQYAKAQQWLRSKGIR